MLVRALFAAVALATIWAVHMNCPWVETSALVFMSAVSLGSIVSPYLGKMAMGTLVILLAMGLAFWVSAVLSNFGFHPVVSRFEVVPTLLIVSLVGVSSALLSTYADYRAWQLLGSLGIFFVPLLLHFYPQAPRVQGAGLVLGILAAVPWLVGLAAGIAIRRKLRDKEGAKTP